MISILPRPTAAITGRIETFTKLYRQFGIMAAFRRAAARLARRIIRVEASEIVLLDAAALPQSVDCDPDFTFRFLTPAEIERFSQDPVYDLPREFAARAASGLDLCFASLDGERLASYGWYALGSIEGEHNVGAAMSYPSQFAYMYKGYTHPDYRGRRLHGTGMALALKGLSQHGVTKLLSTVESTNFASLRSCYRLGYVRLGRIWTFLLRSRKCVYTPRVIRQSGIQIGRHAKVQVRG